MTLAVDGFIRRFLMHVLPSGFHRIRHYGLFASATRAGTIARIRSLLTPASAPADPEPEHADAPAPPCPCCGGRLIIVERFGRGEIPRMWSTAVWADTS